MFGNSLTPVSLSFSGYPLGVTIFSFLDSLVLVESYLTPVCTLPSLVQLSFVWSK